MSDIENGRLDLRCTVSQFEELGFKGLTCCARYFLSSYIATPSMCRMYTYVAGCRRVLADRFLLHDQPVSGRDRHAVLGDEEA